MYRKSIVAAIALLYGCVTLQFVRFYCASTTFYLDMTAYLTGRERLPFQERVLPILFLRPLTESNWVMHSLAHSDGAFTPERGPFYLLSFISFVVAAIYTQRLYYLLSYRGKLGFLVFPIFLFAVMWTYCIHVEADYSYPYDLPSLAFFVAGLYYIYARRFWPLLIVVLIGTFNRETTLFLIGLYIIDGATHPSTSRIDFRLVPWRGALLLSAIWLTIKISLARHFAGNDTSESFLRIYDNLHELKPRLMPALLNICGYTFPLVVIFRRYISPARFRNYLWIFPPWLAVMFCSGVLLETRIYGELCSFSAVALVLIIERFVESSEHSHPALADPTDLSSAAVFRASAYRASISNSETVSNL